MPTAIRTTSRTNVFVFFVFAFFSHSSIFAQSTLSSLEDAFVEVTKKVEPAVVSISTSKTFKQRAWTPCDAFPEGFREDCLQFYSHPRQKEKEYKQQGLGSGVIIQEVSGDAYVLTNNHVVYGADEILVTLPDKREFKGKTAGSDKWSDIAVVKIELKKGEKAPQAMLGDSSKLKVGQWAVAIGNPFGYDLTLDEGKGAIQPTVTVGVISALGRTIEIQGTVYEDLIQTDAAINPGNSGGPLVNIKGEVIGINTAIYSPAGGSVGIGFAIPINNAKEIVDQLLKQGKVAYGFLGIAMDEVDEKVAKHLGLPDKNGVLVGYVEPGSPAEKAGIKQRDVITRVNSLVVKSSKELSIAIKKLKPGTKVKLTLWRAMKEMTVVAVLSEFKESVAQEKSWRGVMVEDISEKAKKYFQLTVEEGAVAAQVEPGSPSEKAGIREGDVILEFAGRPVKTAKDFYALAEKSGAKDEVMVFVQRQKQGGYIVIEPE